ncbi:MAG: LysR family transcriptional regulator [Pseudomonadota bacterium]
MKNFRNIDLNLLVVFEAMLSERSVTKAGERVGLAQPSMSNALTRLRTLFNDELFVRTPNGMAPTQIAIEAAEHVRAAVFAAEQAFNVSNEFDPEKYEGEITLLTVDLIELTVVPSVVRALKQNAPGIRLKTRAMLGWDFSEDLDADRADLALCVARNVPKRFHCQVLCDESFVGIARVDHPITRGQVTIDAFIAEKHAALSQRSGGLGFIDIALEKQGLSRDIPITVSNFAALPLLVVETNMIAVIPRRLAAKECKELPVTMFELPFDVPTIRSKLIWGRGADRSPVSVWFRELLAKIMIADTI